MNLLTTHVVYDIGALLKMLFIFVLKLNESK